MLKALRHKLHMHPDLSGQEKNTADIIIDFVKDHNPSSVKKNIGGYGLLVSYDFGKKGPVIIIRSDLDALPIDETTDLEYKSLNKGVSHKCGHDGHMAIAAGLSEWLGQQVFTKGRVVLLFQPAEETADGAKAMLGEKTVQDINPGYIFALHNLPGYSSGAVIVSDGQMSPAVISLCIKLKGRVSHAAEPDKGINPTLAISTLNLAITKLANNDRLSPSWSLITPVHTRIGTRDFGISPGEGEVNFTLRTWNDEELEIIKKEIEKIVSDTCSLYRLEYSIDEHDYFPACNNDPACNKIIREAASKSGLQVLDRERPFPFGEDFGWFTRDYRASLFGLGTGKDALPLHHKDYDFDDKLIEPGIKMYKEIISSLLS